MKIEISQVLSQMVAFLLMLWILRRYAWKPILDVMEQRKQKIQGEFDSIEEQKKELQVQDEQYRQRLVDLEKFEHEKMQAAVTEAKQRGLAIEEKAQMEARSILAKGQQDLQREVSLAKEQMKNEMVKMVMAATEKILEKKEGQPIQADKVLQLLEEGDKS